MSIGSGGCSGREGQVVFDGRLVGAVVVDYQGIDGVSITISSKVIDPSSVVHAVVPYRRVGPITLIGMDFAR